MMEIKAEGGELLRAPSAADSKNRPAPGDQVEGGYFLGDVKRMALRKNHDTGAEFDL